VIASVAGGGFCSPPEPEPPQALKTLSVERSIRADRKFPVRAKFHECEPTSFVNFMFFNDYMSTGEISSGNLGEYSGLNVFRITRVPTRSR
jgi:hypothetical protein